MAQGWGAGGAGSGLLQLGCEIDIDVDILVDLAVAGAVGTKLGNAKEITGGEELVALGRVIELVRDHGLGLKRVGAHELDYGVLGCPFVGEDRAVVSGKVAEGGVSAELDHATNRDAADARDFGIGHAGRNGAGDPVMIVAEGLDLVGRARDEEVVEVSAREFADARDLGGFGDDLVDRAGGHGGYNRRSKYGAGGRWFRVARIAPLRSRVRGTETAVGDLSAML